MKIVKPLLFVLGSIMLCCTSIHKLYVPFSEAKQVHAKENDGVIRMYFDRFGFIYPDVDISYSDFKSANGLLINYYKSHLTEYENICRKFSVTSTGKYVDTLGTYEDPLQAAIIEKYVKDINLVSGDKELVFIIHGFNEYPLDRRDSSSFREMRKTRQIIKTQFPARAFQYVEIYWDGLSHEGGAARLRKTNSFKIWDNSQASATNTGLELRRVFTQLTTTHKIRVVTHSHGAAVLTTALFNAIKFKEKYYGDDDSWLKEINMKYNHHLYDTPKHEFHAGMLAPAIPGVNVFEEYNKRTIAGKNVENTNQNYYFVMGFNQYDEVTTKFNIAPKHIGSTSLACLKSELDATKRLFPGTTIIEASDFSIYKEDKQKAHSWFIYLDNRPAITEFMTKVFQ